MAGIGKVTINRLDGNITNESQNKDAVSALIIDTTRFKQTVGSVPADGKVIAVRSVTEMVDSGIVEFESGSAKAEHLAYLHGYEFFRQFGSSATPTLYILFNPCGTKETMKSSLALIKAASNGDVRQVGVWSDAALFAGEADNYTVTTLVSDWGEAATEMMKSHTPMSILLTADASIIAPDLANKFANVPSLKKESFGERVSVCISQGTDTRTAAIQTAASKAVGCVGTALGTVAKNQVHTSIAHVGSNNLYGGYVKEVELGFGTGNTPVKSLTDVSKDKLCDAGLIFMMNYEGYAGVYFCKDQTCSEKDFKAIYRNRVIDKSRRAIRTGLLPKLNATLKINTSTGMMAEASIQEFRTIVQNALAAMSSAGEISGYRTVISSTQNVLASGTIKIGYAIIPHGVAEEIIVEEAYTTANA